MSRLKKLNLKRKKMNRQRFRIDFEVTETEKKMLERFKEKYHFVRLNYFVKFLVFNNKFLEEKI